MSFVIVVLFPGQHLLQRQHVLFKPFTFSLMKWYCCLTNLLSCPPAALNQSTWQSSRIWKQKSSGKRNVGGFQPRLYVLGFTVFITFDALKFTNWHSQRSLWQCQLLIKFNWTQILSIVLYPWVKNLWSKTGT